MAMFAQLPSGPALIQDLISVDVGLPCVKCEELMRVKNFQPKDKGNFNRYARDARINIKARTAMHRVAKDILMAIMEAHVMPAWNAAAKQHGSVWYNPQNPKKPLDRYAAIQLYTRGIDSTIITQLLHGLANRSEISNFLNMPDAKVTIKDRDFVIKEVFKPIEALEDVLVKKIGPNYEGTQSSERRTRQRSKIEEITQKAVGDSESSAEESADDDEDEGEGDDAAEEEEVDKLPLITDNDRGSIAARNAAIRGISGYGDVPSTTTLQLTKQTPDLDNEVHSDDEVECLDMEILASFDSVPASTDSSPRVAGIKRTCAALQKVSADEEVTFVGIMRAAITCCVGSSRSGDLEGSSREELCDLLRRAADLLEGSARKKIKQAKEEEATASTVSAPNMV